MVGWPHGQRSLLAYRRFFTSISRTAHLLMSRATSTTTLRQYPYSYRRQVSSWRTPNSYTNRTPTGLLELFRASSPGAAFDSAERPPPPKCLPGTREELLNKVQRWIDSDQTKIGWLHGSADAGKSAIAQTVSETCLARGQLASNFLFSRSAPSRNHARWFFTTIGLQIAHSIPQTRQGICKAVEDDLQILHKQHSAQLK